VSRLFRPLLLNFRDITVPACEEDIRDLVEGSGPVVDSCFDSSPDRFLNRQKAIARE
jgi:hypothetical protein